MDKCNAKQIPKFPDLNIQDWSQDVSHSSQFMHERIQNISEFRQKLENFINKIVISKCRQAKNTTQTNLKIYK